MGATFGATLNLGPPLPGLPFLYTGELDAGCRRVRAAGFEAVDLLVPAPGALSPGTLASALARRGLRLGSIATAAAWMEYRLHLASPDTAVRARAAAFVRGMLELAGRCGGAVSVGLVAGRVEDGIAREQALGWLLESLDELAGSARACGSHLLIEPLNRQETNLLNRLEQGVELLSRLGRPEVRLLADIYHMNREETSVAKALTGAAGWIGHVHFADDNRRAPGFGGLDFGPLAAALAGIAYEGCVVVEALPWPDPETAAARALAALSGAFASARRAGGTL